MISVVMPLFNKEKFIVRAIQSVLAQSFKKFEIIVVNDGSTDSSVSIVNKFSDPRIRLINQKNQGVSSARNTGIKHANFEIIAFLDSDDEWLPTYLETIFLLSQRFSQCCIFATKYQISFNSEIIKNIQINNIEYNFIEGVVENYFEICAHSDPLLWTSATAVKKQAILDVGGFPVGWTSGEDLITWAKLACEYKIAYRNEVLSIFHFNRIDNKKPKRKPDKPDLVGNELKLLNRKYNLVGMRKYLGWYKKNRAVHAFEAGDRKECFLSVMQALFFIPINMKTLQLLLLPFVPRNIYFYRKSLNEKGNNNRG